MIQSATGQLLMLQTINFVAESIVLDTYIVVVG